MKQFLSIIFGIVFSFTIYAQSNSINYKAIIKDGNGNLVANQSITVRFTILSNATNVYQETHTPTTNYNGTVILNIGEGTVNSGIYADIDWGSDDHFLNVQVDTGAGLVDLGTTEFMTVPYALNAANVSGLEAIDEGNGVGWRLIGSNPDNYGNIGENSIDLSNNGNPSTTNGATGDNSVSFGFGSESSGFASTSFGNQTEASGLNSTAFGNSTVSTGWESTAFGYNTTATGNWSTAFGQSTNAIENHATAFGYFTSATGRKSTAFGEYTTADATHSVVLGQYNVGGGSPTVWQNSDPLFEIGNGLSSSSKSNALTVLKDGTITAPSLALGLITDDKSLITKEYFDTNTPSAASGLEALDEGNGIGWRLKGKEPNNYGNLGDNAVDLSHSPITSTTNGATGDKSVAFGGRSTASGLNSVAMGNNTDASGISAVAIGNSTEASGDSAVSMGISTEASGDNAVAMGYFSVALGENAVAIGKNTDALGKNAAAMGNNTKASGDNAVAMGLATEVLGDNAVVMGNGTIAESYASLTLGQYNNTSGGTADSWNPDDPVFEIGNGLSSFNRSNALTVLKNGTITAPTFDLTEITDDKALITKEYADINLISSGLEEIDEGNGLGWRLVDRNPSNYGDIGSNAIDLSYQPSPSNSRGATGETAVAIGEATTASGNFSFASGRYSTASADQSVAMGFSTEASGNYSVAFGGQSEASGIYSFATGTLSEASNIASVAAGFETIASGSYATALGRQTTASGSAATAMGSATTASNIGATSMGSATIASGRSALATGRFTKAEAYSSTALGQYNIGGGDPENWSGTDPVFEIGNGDDDANRDNALTVLKNGKVGIGEHNPDASLEISSNNSASEPTVRLVHEGTTGARINFTNTDVTNGNYWTLYGDPSDVDANSVFNIYHPNAGNIVRVHGDGEVGINGAPNADFHVYHNNNGGASGMKLQNSSDNSWWRFYVSSGSDDLRLFSASQGTTIIGAFDDISGTYTASSDRRLKKNFKDLHFNWEDFMKLKALTYQYKVQKDDEDHIGLIAQDVEPIYPELVNYNEDEDVFHLNYSGFGVVAIKAIQELKAEVNILSEENKKLKKLLSKYETLEARLSALETASKKENVTLIAKQ